MKLIILLFLLLTLSCGGDEPGPHFTDNGQTNQDDETDDCVCDVEGPCCDGCNAIDVGESCDDGRECTLETTCQSDGTCSGATGSPCDELIEHPQCRVGTCDDVEGCSFENIRQDLPCEADGIQDGRCDTGECVGTVCSCDEANECCDGCLPINDGQTCDDGDGSTGGDSCQAGQCVGQPCECSSGACCDGCFLLPADTVCDDEVLNSRWSCPEDGDPASTILENEHYSCDGASTMCSDGTVWAADDSSLTTCSGGRECAYHNPGDESASCIRP